MSKKITLKSSDGKSFEVDEPIALQSQTIAHLVEDDCAGNEIPLANVKSNILAKVIEYCKNHVDGSDEKTKEDLKKWDSEFMKVDNSTIFDLMLAANYLNINGLLALTCQKVADDMLSGKTPDQIRATFNIENDYTPEEEEANRKDYPWAF